MNTRKEKLDELRQRVIKESVLPLFEAFGIDSDSGILSKTKKANSWRYAGYPYIGEQYAEQKVRVVIVGSDLGSDELSKEELQKKGVDDFKEGTYLRFDRIKGVENTSKADRLPAFDHCCAHMAGTYATVITILKNGPTKELYERIKDSRTARLAMKELFHYKAESDLLPYFCMTNVHKFVTVKREEKAGGSNRIWIDKDMEFQTLKAELKVLNPTIVVFQEPSTGNLDAKQIADLKRTLNGCSFIKLQHPSTRKKGGYLLKNDIEMRINEAIIVESSDWRSTSPRRM